ncbi:hypothetical protein PVBG_05786 [Plasmodium vivax Brazil I]|uniref:Uncharacterized protein n=1 Tax=Plasmodium vivax (strain Brazil I) TaxID=1033975 RepID=A0A0J9SKJ6_PLAV1|nr:hypothetical protein PVBG_05786 [Plasmodium vivax Brazil I]
MSKDIMDIDKWKRDLPFLKNVWDKIDDFDKDIENDSPKSDYISTCSYFFRPWNGGKDKHEEFCMKLVRNLGHRSNNMDFLKHPRERCNYLNIWLYNSMKKEEIPEDIITGCFGDYSHMMSKIKEYPRCSYYSYDTNYVEPINIIKLQNFHHNVNTIHDILIKERDTQDRNSQYCYAQRYANECVKIYRDMLNNFCSRNRSLSTQNDKTCSELETFNNIYTNYLFKKGDIYKKIPDLSSSENEKHFLCQTNEQAPEAGLIPGSRQEAGRVSESGPEHGSESHGVEQSDKNIPFNTTSVVSAMAGIPPFLALIYKVIIICT